MSKRKEAMKLHKQLMRDDPKYRAEWEGIRKLFLTMLADVKLRDDDAAHSSTTCAPSEIVEGSQS